jgi:hypothetical protein
MSKYRKKPIVIEAVQWFKHGDHPEVHERGRMTISTGFGDNYAERESEVSLEGCGFIHTLEGDHVVTPGDWIVRGVKGELYSCKPDIFEAAYEAVTSTKDSTND